MQVLQMINNSSDIEADIERAKELRDEYIALMVKHAVPYSKVPEFKKGDKFMLVSQEIGNSCGYGGKINAEIGAIFEFEDFNPNGWILLAESDEVFHSGRFIDGQFAPIPEGFEIF